MKEKKKVEVLKTRDQIITFLGARNIALLVLSKKAEHDPCAPKNIIPYLSGMIMANMETLYCMGESVPKEYQKLIEDRIELVLVASGNIDIDKTNN